MEFGWNVDHCKLLHNFFFFATICYTFIFVIRWYFQKKRNIYRYFFYQPRTVIISRRISYLGGNRCCEPDGTRIHKACWDLNRVRIRSMWNLHQRTSVIEFEMFYLRRITNLELNLIKLVIVKVGVNNFTRQDKIDVPCSTNAFILKNTFAYGVKHKLLWTNYEASNCNGKWKPVGAKFSMKREEKTKKNWFHVFLSNAFLIQKSVKLSQFSCLY